MWDNKNKNKKKGLKTTTKKLIGVCALMGVTVLVLLALVVTASTSSSSSSSSDFTPEMMMDGGDARVMSLRSTMADHIAPFFGFRTSIQTQVDEMRDWLMFQKWYRDAIYEIDSKGLDQALARSHATRASPTPDSKKIAFIFLMTDGHTQEPVWNDFFDEADEAHYNVYAHRANATQNSTFLQHLPSYTEVSATENGWCALMGIEYAGLQAALRDPTNEQFVFVSHNTVPIKSFDYMYDDLIGNSYNTSKFCFTSILGVAASDCRFHDGRRGESSDVLKHHQWVILSRRHAEIVFTEYGRRALERFNELREIKEGMYSDPKMCSDEAVPSLALIEYAKDVGLLKQSQTENDAVAVFNALEELGVEQRCTTFVYWDQCLTGTPFDLGRNYTTEIGMTEEFAHPFPLENLEPTWLKSLVDAPSLLFARKFRANATIKDVNGEIEDDSENDNNNNNNKRLRSVWREDEVVDPRKRTPTVFLNESGILQDMWKTTSFSKKNIELLALPRLNLIMNQTGLVTSGDRDVLENMWKHAQRNNTMEWDEDLKKIVQEQIKKDVEGKTWGAIYQQQ